MLGRGADVTGLGIKGVTGERNNEKAPYFTFCQECGMRKALLLEVSA